MLHDPRAQRRAELRRHLSITADTLPDRLAYIHREIRPGCHLIVVRDGITAGELTGRYATDGRLPRWVRRRLGATGGIDLDQYTGLPRGCSWPDPDQPIGWADVELMEALGQDRGLITRWPHAWLL